MAAVTSGESRKFTDAVSEGDLIEAGCELKKNFLKKKLK